MPQEDYFKREIDKLGKFLAKALSDLRHLKSVGKVQEGIDKVNKTFETELDISVDSLLDLPVNEFLDLLINSKKISTLRMEYIADILSEIADNLENTKALTAYKKALTLYKYIVDNESDYYIGRHYKIERISSVIKNNSLIIAGIQIIYTFGYYTI